MKKLESFISGLYDLEIESVAIDLGEENIIVGLENLKDEVIKIGFKETADTYFEDLCFITDTNNLIEIHAIY